MPSVTSTKLQSLSFPAIRLPAGLRAEQTSDSVKADLDDVRAGSV
jgi:hypothetical protein